LALLGGILSFAVSEGIIPANPVRGIKRPADERREIRLSEEQYRLLGQRLAEAEACGENPVAVLGIRLLALTGYRRGEIESLQWPEVDRAGRCLRLADSKEGRSIRPIGRIAIELLASISNQGQFVLPGRLPNKPFTGLPKAWRRIVKKTPLHWLTLHGLRHAYASVAADLGYTEPTIAALLGHATRTMTARYIHHLDTTLIAAADTVADRIASALDGRSTVADFVQLQRSLDAA
jgi:integrase